MNGSIILVSGTFAAPVGPTQQGQTGIFPIFPGSGDRFRSEIHYKEPVAPVPDPGFPNLTTIIEQAPPAGGGPSIVEDGEGWYDSVYRVGVQIAWAGAIAAQALAARRPVVGGDELVPQPTSTSTITVTLLASGQDQVGGMAFFDFGPFTVTAGKVYLLVLDVVQSSGFGGLEDTPTSGGQDITWLPGFGDAQLSVAFDNRAGPQKHVLFVWAGAAQSSGSVMPEIGFVEFYDNLRWMVLEVTGAAVLGNEGTFPLGVPPQLAQWASSGAQDAEGRPGATLQLINDARNAVVGLFSESSAIIGIFPQGPATSLGIVHSGLTNDEELMATWFPGAMGYPTVAVGYVPTDAPGNISNTGALALEIQAGLSVDDTAPVTPPLVSRLGAWSASPLFPDEVVIAAAATAVDEDAFALPVPSAPWRSATVVTASEEVSPAAVTVVDEDAGIPVPPCWRPWSVAPAPAPLEELGFVVDEDAAWALPPVWRTAGNPGPVTSDEVVAPAAATAIDDDVWSPPLARPVPWAGPVAWMQADERVTPPASIVDEDSFSPAIPRRAAAWVGLPAWYRMEDLGTGITPVVTQGIWPESGPRTDGGSVRAEPTGARPEERGGTIANRPQPGGRRP